MLRYKDFKLIKPDSLQKKQIQEIIDSKGGSVFHEYKLNAIVSTFLQTDLFYLIDNRNDLKSFSPVHITKGRFGQKRYNFYPLGDIPYAGFVGEEVIDVSYLNAGFFESVKYNGFPDPESNSDEIIKAHHGLTNMVDLSLSEEGLFNQVIHSKRRNMIRKALKSGVEVRTFSNEKGLELFWPILNELHRRIAFKSFPFEYYKKIINEFGAKKQAYILVAVKGKIPIAGIFIIGNKKYMHYYKGAGLSKIKNEGQSELLQWEAIKLSKSTGVKYYDLCNLEKEKLPSIYRFKTGFSKQLIPYVKYVKNSIGYKILNRF